MSEVFKHLFTLLSLTLRDAQAGARMVIAGAIPRDAVWIFFAFTVVASAVMSLITTILVPVDEAATEGVFVPIGLVFGMLVGGVILTMAAVAHFVGRAMGGSGALLDAVLLMTWLQLVMVAFQILQTLIMVLMPPLAVLVFIASFVLLFWLLTNFIAALHGFESLGQILVMIVASSFGLAFALALVLSIVTSIVGVGV